jgi:hypothetical protein
MKSVLFTFSILILFSSKSYSQADSFENRLFSNDSIRYDLIYVSPSVVTNDRGKIARYHVRLQMSKDERTYFLKKDTTFWLNRLCNENSDWATNLVLYYLFDRDASHFIIFDKRIKWLKIKKNEILDWKKFLNNQ